MRSKLLFAGLAGMAAAQQGPAYTLTSSVTITVNGVATVSPVTNIFYGTLNGTNGTATTTSRAPLNNATLTFTTPAPTRASTTSATSTTSTATMSVPTSSYKGDAVAVAGSYGFAGLVAAAALAFV